MTTKLSRRSLLGAASAALTHPAVSILRGTTGAGSVKSPQIQQDASINFNDPDILSFVFDAKTELEREPILTDQDANVFELIKPPFVVGTSDQDLYGAKREYYSILEDKKDLREVNAVVLYKQPVVLTIESFLLVAKLGNLGLTDPDLRTRIIKLFNDYQPPKDPIKYALENMGSEISADWFEIRVGFKLDKKTTAPVEYDASQRKRLFDLYSGKIVGVLYDLVPGHETYSLSRYLKDKDVSVSPRLIHEEILTQLPEYKLDPVHQKQLDKPVSNQQEDSALTSLIDGDDGGLDPTTCKLTGSDKRRIAAILAWPEFMIQWVPVQVQVGCVSLTLWLPKVSVRVSDLVLFACVRHEQNLGQAFVDMTIGCIISSALSAMVVGFLTDFAGAMAAYLTLFNVCIGNQVRCLVPNLFLLVESSPWS